MRKIVAMTASTANVYIGLDNGWVLRCNEDGSYLEVIVDVNKSIISERNPESES